MLENVRQLECIFIEGIYYFHLVYFLLVLAIDLLQLAESFSELGEISWERVEIKLFKLVEFMSESLYLRLLSFNNLL